MSFLEAIILGLVQGLTEFLPVSSSGHLVLTQEFLGVKDKGVTFEILVHFGTLLSVVIYFWKPLWRMCLSILPPFKEEYAKDRRMIGFLALASVPAAFVGFSPLKDLFEGAYDRPAMVGIFLIITGLILFLPRVIRKMTKEREGTEIGWKAALAMGVGQAFAILPGISRSGSTIVSGMLAGAKSGAAAEFSFLMAIPAIAAATLLEARKLESLDASLLGPYFAGAAIAFLSGLIAIFTVLAAIRRGKFEYFGIYCLIAGTVAFFYFRSVGA
ncbi:MAG: undecaprenyl-diphosphate phosphatase [Verrucomicrobiales bacterium]|nr:undecaprenyl-diphosphate phosphatase [Verrucomicrobiales bacterium]